MNETHQVNMTVLEQVVDVLYRQQRCGVQFSYAKVARKGKATFCCNRAATV
jgi:hypothetical protein